jgi:hypothetical protein
MLVIITWIALPVSFPAENLYVLILECMCSRRALNWSCILAGNLNVWVY